MIQTKPKKLSGSFCIDKPAGVTSSDVVMQLKKNLLTHHLCEKPFKIGHGGTLDPFAKGVLVVLLGEATKLADTYLHSKKSYSGVITLGSKTNTADLTGQIIDEKPIPSLSLLQWQQLADTFVQAPYWQTPPMYSAKKIEGQPLHKIARQGLSIERAAILKKIYSFQLQLHSPSHLAFQVSCESGTYVRTLAEDLAEKGNTLAHLQTLIRTQSSDVTLENCVPLEDILTNIQSNMPLNQCTGFCPLTSVATHVPHITISAQQALLLSQGMLNVRTQVLQDFLIQYPNALTQNIPYFLARLPDHSPVALFEKLPATAEENSYRLQRILIW